MLELGADPLVAIEPDARSSREAGGLGFGMDSVTLTLDAAGVRALFATYSNVTVRAPDAQERLPDGLVEIAEQEFGGVVHRNMVTVLYLAR